MQEMKQELNLTDAQVAQIKTLHEKKAAERKQEMAAKKQDRMKMMKDNEAEMQKQVPQNAVLVKKRNKMIGKKWILNMDFLRI